MRVSMEDHGAHECLECAMRIEEIYAMLSDIKEFLDPLKALAGGLGPMQKMGMSPQAKAALAKIR